MLPFARAGSVSDGLSAACASSSVSNSFFAALLIPQVPNQHRGIGAAGGEIAAVGGEGEGANSSNMPLQFAAEFAGRNFPDANNVLAGGSDLRQHAAVWRPTKCHRARRLLVELSWQTKVFLS